MALIQCHECNRLISKSAKACPACGAPKKDIGCLTALLIVGVFLIGFFILTGSCGGSSSKKSTSSTQSYIPTKQEKLEEYHRRGEFTGYSNPADLERDMKALEKSGSAKAGRVARELRSCR